MSCITIKDWILSGKKALCQKNYLATLVIALILPGMCSSVEYADTEMSDTDKYKKWCSEFLPARVNTEHCRHKNPCYNKINFDKSVFSRTFGSNYPDVLYQLRCGIVHSGNVMPEKAKVDGVNNVIFFASQEETTLFFYNKKIIVVSVPVLCRNIFNYSDKWCRTKGIQTENKCNFLDAEDPCDNEKFWNLFSN